MYEQTDGTYDNPFKFNAKELDDDTGLYYYGARYYNPRLSIWYGVDPLAVYNPVMETEFYGEGQHNGGVFFWGNNNPYIYTYQNPIKYVDPNGKQTIFHKYMNSSDSEKKVMRDYPLLVYRMRYDKGSNSMGTVATRFANSGSSPESSSIFSSENEGKSTGGINAMRHTLLSAFAHSSFDDDAATEILTAHENNTKIDMNQRDFDSYNEVDMAADYHNNELGKKVGGGWFGYFNSRKGLLKKAADIAKNEGVWVGEKQGKKFRLKQVKISEEKYNDFIKMIEKKDSNGNWKK